jgi:hypothetical protein
VRVCVCQQLGGPTDVFFHASSSTEKHTTTGGKGTAAAAAAAAGGFVPYPQYAHEKGSKQKQARSFSDLELYKVNVNFWWGRRRRRRRRGGTNGADLGVLRADPSFVVYNFLYHVSILFLHTRCTDFTQLKQQKTIVHAHTRTHQKTTFVTGNEAGTGACVAGGGGRRGGGGLHWAVSVFWGLSRSICIVLD